MSEPPDQPTRLEDPSRLLSRLWGQGQRPDIAAFLTRATGLTPAQLVAVLAVDQRGRWQAGERVPAEDYLRDFPTLGENAEAALELVYREFLLCESLGEAPDPEEYVRRFPQLAARLRLQVELHRALEQAAPPSPGPTVSESPALTTLTGPHHTLPTPPPAPGGAGPGLQVPGYAVLGVLGRGGMGVVYRAWQSRLGREVALKMILSGAHAGPHELERFRIEVEAAGRLQHPNIVAVHEVGEHDGRPFLVMEYVEGGSLAKRLAGTPLPARPAAELLEKLARAVHHAHQRGVVHRDLKPANILLQRSEVGGQGSEVRGQKSEVRSQKSDGEGEGTGGAAKGGGPSDLRPLTSDLWPKIADFGLAKFLRGDGSGPTPPGQVLGTPSYMAPEQAGGRVGEVGPVTDVYALGAVLYETLTGRPPFKSSTLEETLHQVLTVDPVPPSRLQPKVPRDLETICLKCLEKEPRKRYGSAQELADELVCYLEGRPIRARPVGAWGRTAKWARRRPAAAALVVLLAVTVLGVAAGGWWHSIRVDRERQEAVANFRLALGAVERMLTEAGAVDLADVPQMEPVREKLLRDALPFFETFLAKHGDDPAVRQDAARAYGRLGDVLALLRKQDEAEHAYRQALTLLGSGDESRRERARTLNNLGVLLKDRKRFPDAEAVLGEARTLWDGLAAASPEDMDCREQLAAGHYHLATVLARQTGREKEAGQAYDEALRRQRQLAAGDRPEHRRALARTLNNVGLLRQRLGRPDAEEAFREAAAIQQALAEGDRRVPAYRRELARTCNNLGALRADHRQAAAAREAYRKAESLLGQLMRDFPRVPAYRQEWASVQMNLGKLWQADRRPADAEAAFREALRTCRELTREFSEVPDHHYKLAEAHRRLGNLLRQTGRPGEAERAYREALRLARDLATRYSDESEYQVTLGWALSNLGQFLFLRSELAEPSQRAELFLAPASGNPWAVLAPLARARAALAEATACFDEAVERQQAALTSSAPGSRARLFLRNDCWYRAECRVRLGRYAEAAAAAELLPRLSPDDPREYVVAAAFLARCLPGPNARRAVELLEEAIRKGYRNVRELESAPFAPLRRRPDFRRLLEQLRRRTESAVG